MGTCVGGGRFAAGLDPSRRDACLHALGTHYAAGRLSVDELEKRVQEVLAADTEETLTALLSDVEAGDTLGQGPPALFGDDEPSRPLTHVVHLSPWAAAVAVLPLGGAALAAVGPRSDAAEFTAGAGLGLLGFVTHWALTTRRRPGVDAAVDAPQSVVADSAILTAECDESAVDEVTDVVQIELRPFEIRRRSRVDGSGTTPRRSTRGGIPAQRTGD